MLASIIAMTIITFLGQRKEPKRQTNVSGFSKSTAVKAMPYLQVLGAWVLFFNTYGVANSFSVFQAYYESSGMLTASSSNISWIGSIQSFLIQFAGLLTGPIFDRGHIRGLILTGGSCITIGHLALSFSTTWWQVFLAQGICTGLGMGCLLVPCISLLPPYFPTRIGLVMGIASSGASIGGVIYPILMHKLITVLSFAWSVRIMGLIVLLTLSIPLTAMRIRHKPVKARVILDVSTFQDFPFMWLSISIAISFLGFSIFHTFASFYAMHQNLTSRDLAFNLSPIYNGLATIGRIVPGALSDRVGPFNIMIPSACMLGVMYYLSIIVSSASAVVTVTAIAGFLSGIFTAMPPLCFTRLVKEQDKLGTWIGTGYAIASLGLLIGGPIGGAILGQGETRHWATLWTFAGTIMLVASALLTVSRINLSGFHLFAKV